MAISTGENRHIMQELGIPLKKLLELPVFHGSRILAGSSGLGRLVTGVNIMEVPDIVNWVKPGHLLVTTGFAIRDNQEAQQNLVPSLARLGLAGICIKTRRYLETIPPPMLQLADAYEFPLVELPPEIGFADLIYEVLSAILHEQSAFLLQLLDVHSALMKIMIEGGGLQKIALTLASLVNNSVYISDILNDRHACSCVNWPEKEIDVLLAAAKAKAAPGDGLYQRINNRLELAINDRSIGCFYMPLTVASECYGSIYIWETMRPLNSSDISTIERLAVVTALEIARERSLREVERRYSNEFLNHLLSGRIEDEKLELEHARKLGWDLERNYVVGLVWPLPPREDVRHLPNQETKNRVLRELPRRMLEHGVHCLVGTKGDYLVILLAVDDRGLSARQINELARKQMKAVQECLTCAFTGWEVRIGLGRFYPGLKGLQQSYQEAKQALRISENLPGRRGVIAFNDLGIYRFIYSRDREKEVNNYLQETLGKLLEYDREKNTELIRTLQAYFEHHGNLKKVSEALFTHYNTILYRLERIQEISGMDLNCPEDRFNLEVALKLLNGKVENK